MTFTEDEIQALQASAESWAGTPHRHRIMIKGKGVDCVHFVAAVFAEAGIVEPFKRLPSYPVAWGLMSPENVLGKGLAAIMHGTRATPDKRSLREGDVVIFKAGRQANHAGLYLGGKIWHVMTGGVVHPANPERFAGKIQESFRLHDRGWKTAPTAVNIHRLLEE